VLKHVEDVGGVHLGGLGSHAGGEIGVADDVDAVVGDGLVLLREGAIAAADGSEIDDDTAGLHVLDHVVLDKTGRRAAGDGGGGNDDVTLLQMLVESVLLGLLERGGGLLGVTTLTSAFLLEVNLDPGGTEGSSLIGHIADIPGADDGTGCLGGTDGGQTGNTTTQDEGLGRGVLTSGGHLGGVEATVMMSGLNPRADTGNLGLGREDIEGLGDGDTGDRGHIDEHNLVLVSLLDEFLTGGEQATHPGHATLALHVREILAGSVDREQNVGPGNDITAAQDLAAVLLVDGIKKSTLVTSAGLDEHAVAGLDEAGEITGHDGNTALGCLGIREDT